MTSEYIKYVAARIRCEDLSLSVDSKLEVFSTRESYYNRRDEIDQWIGRLTKSIGWTEKDVTASPSTWAEATIKKDTLFETHFPKKNTADET